MPPRVLRTLIPAVALLLAPLPPAEALEKCVGPEAVAPCTPARIEYFDVQGDSHEALLSALNARGRFHGRADWKLLYRYQIRPVGSDCAVGDLTTTLELVMTLPRWTPPAGAPGELVARWQRYVAALRIHEEGHLQHGRDFEREFRAAAATLADRNCDLLRERVSVLFNDLLARYQSRDKLYDEDTGHGRTQGAIFR
jgi:predicted secreted Zn-dependent protease